MTSIVAAVDRRAPSLASDYAHCLRVARHAENFPVASRLLPKESRHHLAAIYAFARGADDLADEPRPHLGTRAIAPDPASRLRALDEWESGLDGKAPGGAEPVFRALAATRSACGLSEPWLRDLLTAFRWDVTRDGYDSWDDLRRYCDHSAAPIGRLVLEVTANRDAPISASDDLCVALQLTNFWQDLSVDWPRGRLYLPRQSWGASGLDRAALRRLFPEGPIVPEQLVPSDRIALAGGLEEAIARTEALFEAARSLPERVDSSARSYLAAVWEGGRAVLERARRLGEDAFVTRASLGWKAKARLLWRVTRRLK